MCVQSCVYVLSVITVMPSMIRTYVRRCSLLVEDGCVYSLVQYVCMSVAVAHTEVME